jgi:UDPglucose--hexose-1-phosphate uridylyltransferase
MTDWRQQPHRRRNPLTGEWVLVSPHRTDRPWQGQVEKSAQQAQAAYDPNCYLCPGNARAGGARNPAYTGTFVFDNDFAALKPDSPPHQMDEKGLLVARTERGICRVVCFLPRHDLTLARMSREEIVRVMDTWCEQYRELGAVDWIRYVQVFENRGEMMGASNPHPHCQIWSSESLPNEIVKESASQGAYLAGHGECMLCEYLKAESAARERVVLENDGFAALVPFWAVWPFEVILVSKRHFGGMDELRTEERAALADVLKRMTTRYDNLFQTPFPYSMGFHPSPTDSQPHREWHFHAHYHPPLLRSASVRKFMVGYELLAGPQRDITPESAAMRLRELPERHYLDE